MKAPLALTAIILLGGAIWGVNEQRTVTKLREKHRLVLKEAERLGVSTDPSKPFAPHKHGKRQREDGGRKVRDFAETLVSFAKEMKEMEKSGKQPDAEMQKRIMDLMDGMLSLNGDELKILIAELRGRSDMDDEMRKGMIGFSIMMLAQEHPEKALAIFTESSDLLEDNPMRGHVLSSSLTQWAKDQPLAAVEWMKNNAAKHPDLINEESKRAVITGVAAKDFGLAFQLAAELKLPAVDHTLISMMARAADTPERQNEMLAAIRKQAAGMTDKSQAGEFTQAGVNSVFSRVMNSGYDTSIAWLENAGLSDQETSSLVTDLNYHSTKADSGKWLDWIARNGDPKLSENSTRHIVSEWTKNDYKAAGEWLAKAPASPIKEAAVISYAETVAPYDPEVAAQWADTLTGDGKSKALKRIHSQLKSKNKAAADEFAGKHGLGDD